MSILQEVSQPDQAAWSAFHSSATSVANGVTIATAQACVLPNEAHKDIVQDSANYVAVCALSDVCLRLMPNVKYFNTVFPAIAIVSHHAGYRAVLVGELDLSRSDWLSSTFTAAKGAYVCASTACQFAVQPHWKCASAKVVHLYDYNHNRVLGMTRTMHCRHPQK